MTAKEKTLFWGGIFILLGLFVTLVHSILLPFVVAGIIAYFLDPAADKLEKSGISRTTASLSIIGIFFFICALAAILLLPLLYDQFLLLYDRVPEYTSMIRTRLLPAALRFARGISPETMERVRDALGNISGMVLEMAGQFFANLLKSGFAILNILSLIFLTPIITFYILRDWDTIIRKIDGWLPRHHLEIIRQQMREVDDTLSGYIRGQTNVCMLMGAFYGIGLSLVELESGLSIGLATGLFTFIPYVGFFSGFAVGMGVAFVQFGLATEFWLVLGVFMIGQVIESNFITPKLVGDKVGLHPVWLIFGMLAGAAIFGFVGVLIAVPVTAILGVAVRFLLEKYLRSPLYLNILSYKQTAEEQPSPPVEIL